MTVKATTAFLLALVFQLAQLQGMANLLQGCVMTTAAHCECCAGPDSCPCAKSDESAPKPAPLLPASASDLKSPLAKSGKTRVSVETRNIPAAPAALEGCPVERPWVGYTGVPLAVAFCSFII